MNQVKRIFEYDPTLVLAAIAFLIKMRQATTKQKKAKILMHPATRDYLIRKRYATNLKPHTLVAFANDVKKELRIQFNVENDQRRKVV